MWRELSKPWSTFTSRTSLQAECLMIGNKEWVLKHSSYYHTEKDGTTKRVEFNATKQPEELKNKIIQ